RDHHGPGAGSPGRNGGTVNSLTRRKLPALTTEQMREVDRVMVEDLHIELVQMMENVGRGLAELAIDRFSPGSVTVLAGPGGDGRVGGGQPGQRGLPGPGGALRAGPPHTVPAHQADILGRMGIRIAEQVVHSIYNGYWLLGRAGKGPAAPTAGAAGAVWRNQI